MKKFWLIALSLLLVVAMTFGIIACDKGKDDDKDGGDETGIEEVAGDYSIDLSALGMPLIVYLRIEEDGKFMFSGSAEFTADKNSGTVSKSSTGYLMVYSTVNGSAANGETTKFTKESNGNLKFDGTMYYGSTKPTSPMENEDTGKTEYLYAVPYTEGGGEELVQLQNGVYYGTYTSTSTGMGAGTVYEYYLTLRDDDNFTSFVSFSMGESTYYVYDYGTFEAMNSNGRLTSSVYKDTEDATKPLSESVQALSETEVKAEVRVGPMLKDLVEIEMEKIAAPTTPVMQFEGEHTIQMGQMSMAFELSLSVCADGSYVFTSTASGEEPSEETGFIGFDMMNDKVYVLPDGVTSGVTGSYDSETNTITAKFSLGAGSPQEVQLTMTDVDVPPVEPAPAMDNLYEGEYTQSAMGTTLSYRVKLFFNEGKYIYVAIFDGGTMGTSELWDYGSYTKQDGVMTLTSQVNKVNDAFITGTVTIGQDKVTAKLYADERFSSQKEFTLEKPAAPSQEVMVQFTYSISMGGGSIDTTLTVYEDYTYHFVSEMGGEVAAEETGFFMLAEEPAGVFLPVSGSELYNYTADTETLKLSAAFDIGRGTRTDLQMDIVTPAN